MHFCSWSSWAWVKLINKQAGKSVLFHKFHCFLKIFICLSWKTTDDVCSNCYSRHSVKKVERNTELRTCKSFALLKASVHGLKTFWLSPQKWRPKMIFGKIIKILMPMLGNEKCIWLSAKSTWNRRKILQQILDYTYIYIWYRVATVEWRHLDQLFLHMKFWIISRVCKCLEFWLLNPQNLKLEFVNYLMFYNAAIKAEQDIQKRGLACHISQQFWTKLALKPVRHLLVTS